jgi:hypothetical protein
MTCFIAKIVALVVTLMATSSIFVSATNVRTKFTLKGYSAYASADFEGCSYLEGSSLQLSAYGSQFRFKEVVGGETGMVQSDVVDDFYLSFTKSSCDNSTITLQRGFLYDSSSFDSIQPDFKIERDELTKASLRGIQVPVYGNKCSYVCTEVCYAEIFGYGTCPPELPELSCYTTECGMEQFMGVAKVSVVWKVPNRLGNVGLATSTSVYRTRTEGYTYMSRSRGEYRYDVPVTIKATLNGVELFPSEPVYEYGELAKTRSKDVSKTKCIE